MQSGPLSIGELADAAGLSRRAVRFYVQQKLLPPPAGLGRGRHYDASHLDRLRRIAELQAGGHSLDAIRRILEGRLAENPAQGFAISEVEEELPPARPGRARPVLSAELWTRLRLMEGVELHFDASRHGPDVQKLLQLREFARDVFQRDPSDRDNGQDETE